MKQNAVIILCLLFMITPAFGQNPVLDEYIREGLESNRALKQHELDYTKSLMALKEAKGYLLPNINLNARYTLADGGRIIEFPVGDLLNPVYNTLNLLTASSLFPAIENQEFTFYRAKEQETKVSLVQPLYSSDIINNVKIKKDFTEINKIGVDQYKRYLINEIKTAYYNYMKAVQFSVLIDSSLILVNENLRVSNVLYRNDIVTLDAVYRSEVEISKLEVEKANSTGALRTAQAYFNFLLNRPLESDIKLIIEEAPSVFLSLEEFQQSAIDEREELEYLQMAQHLNKQIINLHNGSLSPDLFASIDYGFQGEEYRFTEDDDFVLASLVFRWNLFHGMTSRNKVKQARIEGEKLYELESETEMKIKTQVISNYFSALAAYDAIRAAKKSVLASQKAFKLISRRYAEGQASLLEYIDARTSLTNAKSRVIIAENDYFITLANLEYAAASLDIYQY